MNLIFENKNKSLDNKELFLRNSIRRKMKGFLNQSKQQRYSEDFKIIKSHQHQERKKEGKIANEYLKQHKRSQDWQAYVNNLKNEYENQKSSE